MVQQRNQRPAPLSKEEIERQLAILDQFIPAALDQRIPVQDIRSFVNEQFAPEAANKWINAPVYDWDLMNTIFGEGKGGDRSRAVRRYTGAWRSQGYQPTNATRIFRSGIGPISWETTRQEAGPDLPAGIGGGLGAYGAGSLLSGGAGLVPPTSVLPAGVAGPLGPGQVAGVAGTGRLAALNSARNAMTANLPGGMMAAPMAGVGLGVMAAPSVTSVWDRIFGDPRYQ